MEEPRDRPTAGWADGRAAGAGGPIGEGLFGWRGAGAVLLGERAGDRWVLARGYARGDRLSDVRRWSFATAPLLAAQVRRLAQEATGDAGVGAAAFGAALAWGNPGGAAVAADPRPPAAEREPPAPR